MENMGPLVVSRVPVTGSGKYFKDAYGLIGNYEEKKYPPTAFIEQSQYLNSSGMTKREPVSVAPSSIFVYCLSKLLLLPCHAPTSQRA